MSDENGSLRRAAIAASIAVLFAAGAFLHIRYFNGPDYWSWGWIRRHDGAAIAALFALAAAPALFAERVRRRGVAVVLVALSAVALQAAALSLAGRPPLQRLGIIISDPASTSYYTAAVQVLDWQGRAQTAWVPKFDRLLHFFPLHARTKPLLPVAFYLELLRLFGPSAPLAAGLIVAMLTMATVAAIYFAVRGLAGHDAAIVACTLFALMPAVAIFFPQLDVVYPLFTAGIVATWPRALRGSIGAAAAFGVVVFVMSLASYALLVVGAFCVLLALRERLRNVVVAGGVALLVIVAAYALLQLVTGYPAVAAFRAALDEQRAILPHLHRPYPLTVPFDLLDFILGAGWAPAIVAVLWSRQRAAVAAIVTPPIVALTGLLQAETARVWIFLLPLVAVAAALEMARWRRAARLLVYASIVVVTIAVYLNMSFTFERVWPISRGYRVIPTNAVR